MTIRVIPRLDIKGPNLVKGIHCEGLRVLGKPEVFARHYYEQGADELIYMDVVASLYGRNNLLEIVTRTAREIFIPLTVGGGIRTLDDIKMVLRAGADKVSLNTAAIGDPNLIKEAVKRFGSSTIVVSIEVIRRPDKVYEAYTDNGRERTHLNAFEWALKAAELGAGEILLTSIDYEGTGKGYDVAFTQKIAEAVSVPIIACGGAGCKEHVLEVIQQGKADAVSFASILHYDFLNSNAEQLTKQEDYQTEGNIEFLRNQRAYLKIQPTPLLEVKKFLKERGIDCRYPLFTEEVKNVA